MTKFCNNIITTGLILIFTICAVQEAEARLKNAKNAAKTKHEALKKQDSRSEFSDDHDTELETDDAVARGSKEKQDVIALKKNYLRETERAKMRSQFKNRLVYDLAKSLMVYKKKFPVKDDREYYFYFGYVLENRGEYRRAVESYLTAIRISPDYARARNSLGNLYCKLHKYDFAITHFLKALRVNPFNPFLQYNLGNLYHEIEKTDDAIFHLGKAVKYKRNFGSAYHKLGVCFFKKKKFEKSVENFKEAIKYDAVSHISYYYMGLSYFYLEKGSLAIYSMRRALAIKTDFFEAALKLGDIHHAYGEYSYALKYYIKANSLNPDYKELKMKIVECYRELKRYRDAIKLVTYMMARDPENEALKNLLKSLQKRRLIENLEHPYDYYTY